ncbi:MAG TPA: response regulator [Rhodospirillales bacterium]|jgi:CheY-like chemotaxis protein|nr:response regulator [Rhodospirillales bacterium]
MLHKRKTILVIDDSSTIRAFVAGLLSKNGFQTLEAETMESVFADMARMHFDLAVIDIFMPGMGGIAGIAKVKECWPDIKIIAISAGVDEMDKNRALKAATLQGADQALAKPFTDDEMIAAVDGLLEAEEAIAV